MVEQNVVALGARDRWPLGESGDGRTSIGLALFGPRSDDFRSPDGSATVVLLGHMGGPFWAHKDEGAWSFPKGLVEPSDRDATEVADREFAEELGVEAPSGPCWDLGSITTRSKTIRLLAREAGPGASNLPPELTVRGLSEGIASNTFEMEWPPKSGRMASFPEIDRARWVTLGEAATLLSKNQRGFVARLTELVAGRG